MSYDSNSVLNAVMTTLLGKISQRQTSSFYKVPYRSILNVTTALESIQEQRVTPLVENDNQQQIYIWVRNHLLLPSGRGDYTDWELCKSVEGRILLKLIWTAINDYFCVPNITLQGYLNSIFLPLKRSLLKHLWCLMSLGKTNNKNVRKTISEELSKKLGHQTYLLKDEESYIVETSEI